MDASLALDGTASQAEEPLTPRTKVARMLADIDNEIDQASSPSPLVELPGKRIHPAREVSPSSALPSKAHSATTSGLGSTQDASMADLAHLSGSDDSDDGSVKPQGRAARRMFGLPNSSTALPVQLDLHDDEDDLYSATPMKQASREKRALSPSTRELSGSPLFVSPAKSGNDDSDDDFPTNPLGGKEKLAELVAQKRAERLQRQAAEQERSDKTQPSPDLPEEAFERSQDPADPNIERIMSDATRPSRKASKKALLEMERETQRLARQQALAHQIKVKKKFTAQDLLSRFNFRPTESHVETLKEVAGDENSTGSSVPNSDGAEERPRESASTPPSSPPTAFSHCESLFQQGSYNKAGHSVQHSAANLCEIEDDDELPDLAELMKSSTTKQLDDAPIQERSKESRAQNIARTSNRGINVDDTSDDELDILPRLPSHLQAFDKAIGSKGGARSADSNAIQRLKHLSNLHAGDARPQKKGSRLSITPQALYNRLRKQAKDQARQQQLERIEELRAKGIELQTIEEREKEAEAMENLLEKAREDAVKLREAERAAKKAGGTEAETMMQASDDEEDDEDYISGSEEESEGGDEDDAKPNDNDLIADVAEETSGDEDEDEDEADDASVDVESQFGELPQPSPVEDDHDSRSLVPPDPLHDNNPTRPATQSRHSRKPRVIVDEDDDDEVERTNPTGAPSPIANAEDPFAAFNFENAGNGSLLYSPTQAFHATMQTPTQMTQEDSFDVLRRLAPPSAPSLPDVLPNFDEEGEGPDPDFVEGSQISVSQRVNLAWETQAPETPVPGGLHRETSGLSVTPGWEPSQDCGLPSPWSVKARPQGTVESIANHDTQSTVRMRISESPEPSLAAPQRRRLGRRATVLADDTEDGSVEHAAHEPPTRKDAFREMARRRKDALTEVEREEASREMRGMMDEQAEESDDEYAGVGGDDYVAPETEQDKEMIDSSHIEVDERALASHFAEKQRLRDEAETSRLYKDLTTGVLRRKMGADAFDLEEDEDEMAARRRQMRQQDEARKRKALLKDMNVANLAEGKLSKGKDAFLRAIADDDAEDDATNLSDGEDETVPATQEDAFVSQSHPEASGPLVETNGNKRPRLAGDEADSTAPPLKQRHTTNSALRRPTSLLEVRESVSFLLEESHGAGLPVQTDADLYLDSDADEADDAGDQESSGDEYVAAEAARVNDGGFAPNPRAMEAQIISRAQVTTLSRRTSGKSDVVDRLSLKRSASSMESAHERTAWATGPTTGGFKVPSLLRRATTSTTSTASMANDRGVTTPSLSRGNSDVKMGGTKKSSLAYQARAEERRAIVEASAKRREESTARIGQLRRNSSALNRGVTGRFE